MISNAFTHDEYHDHNDHEVHSLNT